MEISTFDIRRVPLLWPVLLWTVGLLLVRSDAVSISVAATLFLLIVSALLYLRKFQLAVVLLLGVAWGTIDLLQDASDMAVDQTWLNSDLQVTATVVKVEQGGSSLRLLLSDIERSDGESVGGKALLYLYGKRDLLPDAGQQIAALVRWRQPQNYRNPGAFDYRSWCFDRAIALIGSAKGDIRVIDDRVSLLEVARARIRSAIAFAGEREQGVLHALLLGERSRVQEPVSRVFSATGTAHLLAISGMHVGMAAAWLFALLWWLLTRREAWIVKLPVRNVAMTGGMIGAVVYAALAGWPLPAIRATLMLAAAVVAWQLTSKHESFNILLAALGLILLFDASAITSISLWLSFVATAALLLWGKQPERKQSLSWSQRIVTGLRMLFWSSLLAMLATLPIVVTTFGTLPLYGLPANLLLVPLYGLIVLPSALLGEVAAVAGAGVVAGALMQFSGTMAGAGIDLIEAISMLPAGTMYAVLPPLWLSLLYVAGMVAAGVIWWKQKKRAALLMLLLTLGGYLGFILQESDVDRPMWLVWDVGQGAASTLLLPGGEVLNIDAPGYEGSRFNGGTTVATGLRAVGQLHADVLIFTHAQSDHLGGALSLAEGLNWIGEIWLPDVPSAHGHRSVQRLITAGSAVRWLSRGDRVAGRGYVAEVLWPPKDYAPANRNNSSLVVLIRLSNGIRALFPGDIEAEVERQLLTGGLGPVDVMLMPHHGSRSSSTTGFVKQVQPGFVVAQAGRNNRYGFPDSRVVARYRESGAVFVNTADGAVLMELSALPALQQREPGISSRRDMALKWWQPW